MIRALNVLFPDSGPGGFFPDGSIEATLDDVSRATVLINKIARTQTRAWMEVELASDFGLDRGGLKPSLQIEVKHGRSLPNGSLKWNSVTVGITNRLKIEEATVRYLNERLPGWGNNRSPNNDYVSGSTLSRGFESQSKIVYFDHLRGDTKTPIVDEAFTGLAPGRRDIEAWVQLANRGLVQSGMIINFQNERGQSINTRDCANSLVRATKFR